MSEAQLNHDIYVSDLEKRLAETTDLCKVMLAGLSKIAEAKPPLSSQEARELAMDTVIEAATGLAKSLGVGDVDLSN